MGVLDHTIRETVIDRVMALDSEEVDLEQLKWVILMVLFNQPGNEAAAAWMEDIVIDEVAGQIH
jgi:Smg protein